MDHLNKINVLVTGGGAPGAAGIIRCIRESEHYHIVAGDVKEDCVGKFLADDYVQLLPGDDRGFADAVLNICREKKISLVLPLVTKELFSFSAALETFAAEGVRILVSPPPALRTANNKGALYDFFGKESFIPAYKRCSTVKELEQAIGELGYPSRAVCFKPCLSNGSRGFRILDEHIDRFEHLFQQKPGNAYTTWNEVKEILKDKKIPELLVSEYLPGEEYSVDAVCTEGRLIAALPRKRSRMIGGISVEGEFEQNETLLTYTQTIVTALQLHGNIGLQFKKDSAGAFKLLEVNPRVQGTVSACLGAGLNVVLMALDYAAGKSIPSTAAGTIRWGTKFIRFWSEVFYRDNGPA